MPLTLTAAADDSGRRLDRILRKALRDLPLSAIHRLLRQGAVLVDGKKANADYRVQSGQSITINSGSRDPLEIVSRGGAELQDAQGNKRKLNILFEGAGLLILNKAAGITVHGKDSLEDQVLSYLRPKLPPSLSFRPGPLHRLDKPSSGIIAFSTNLEGARFFSVLLRERKITKQYLAIVEGVIEKAKIWQDELARDHTKKKTFTSESRKKSFQTAGQIGKAKTALTRVSPLACNSSCTLILAEIETGRTHQIRAQAAAHGHPLLGDKKYGSLGTEGSSLDKSKNLNDSGFMLHAWRMELPEGTALPRFIEAPLPDRFMLRIKELFGKDFAKLCCDRAPVQAKEISDKIT